MKYYQIDTMGEDLSDDYCLGDEVEGLDDYCCSLGISFSETEYAGTTITLDDDCSGLMRGSFLGTSSDILAVKKEVADLIKKFNVGEIEEYPFDLINHRGRIHSKDYVILNPIGSKDYLNKELSEIKYRKDGSVRSIYKLILDQEKLEKEAPDLFRIPEDRQMYFFSERLVNAIKEAEFTNFSFEEVEQG